MHQDCMWPLPYGTIPDIQRIYGKDAFHSELSSAQRIDGSSEIENLFCGHNVEVSKKFNLLFSALQKLLVERNKLRSGLLRWQHGSYARRFVFHIPGEIILVPHKPYWACPVVAALVYN